jgi:hypothetical protein
VVAEHFDSAALLKRVLGQGARKSLDKADRKALSAFLAQRATSRLSGWIATLPPPPAPPRDLADAPGPPGPSGAPGAAPGIRMEPRSVQLGRDSTREVTATFDLFMPDGQVHLVEVLALRGKKKKARWKVWDVRCGTAGLHLSRQYTAQFRSLRRDLGLDGLVAKARSMTR